MSFWAILQDYEEVDEVMNDAQKKRRCRKIEE